ncbi:hypothetical protein QIA36_04885 (plasmid) [Borreliella yangtzensis]|uniref:hypothetical protein n=1 Tax=Borreliella yangtzensis TaxID=683292 RepID=UPI003B21547A
MNIKTIFIICIIFALNSCNNYADLQQGAKPVVKAFLEKNLMLGDDPNSHISSSSPLKTTLDNGGQQKQEVAKETEVTKERERELERESYNDNDNSDKENSLQSTLTNINKLFQDIEVVNPPYKKRCSRKNWRPYMGFIPRAK